MTALVQAVGLFPVSRAFWRRQLASSPHATYFHTPMWADSLQEAFGYPSDCFYFRHERDEAILVLTRRQGWKGLVQWAVSGETGVYGGPVGGRCLSQQGQSAFWEKLTRQFPNVTIFGNPLLPDMPVGQTNQATHLLKLASWRRQLSRGCRARCHKAERAGLDLVIGERGEDSHLFWPLYEDSVRRWGANLTWKRPRRFFEAVLAKSLGHVRLLLAEHRGELVSGVLVATYGGVAHYLAGASLGRAFDLCPSNFLIVAALEMAEADGCHTFDFGPSAGMEGVIRFKESFGAQAVAFGRFERHDARVRVYRRMMP